MEQFKIANFEKSHDFKLEFTTLTEEMSLNIISEILKHAGGSTNEIVNFFSIVAKGISNSFLFNSINSKHGFTDLLEANPKLQTDKLLVIWDNDQPVDSFSTQILAKYWDYIWYGTSDEAMVLFSPNKFIILISDWGEIRVKYIS